MGESGGTGWRGTYKFDNNNIGILTGDGYSYYIGHNGGQANYEYTAKVKIISKDSILIYDFFDQWLSYTRVGKPPAPGTNYIDSN